MYEVSAEGLKKLKKEPKEKPEEKRTNT